MGSLWRTLGAGARLGIPAAAICAIVIGRMSDNAHRISAAIDGEDESGFEPHLYSEYPFPFGRADEFEARERLTAGPEVTGLRGVTGRRPSRSAGRAAEA